MMSGVVVRTNRSASDRAMMQAASGNLSNEAYASLCIPLLIAHVLRQQDEVLHTLTYSELATLLGPRDTASRIRAAWARCWAGYGTYRQRIRAFRPRSLPYDYRGSQE